MIFGAAVIEELDFKPVVRPIQARRGCCHAQSQRAFVAHRQLHQDRRQSLVGQKRAAHAPFGMEETEVAQHEQLGGEHGKQHQHTGEPALQDQR